MEVTATCRRCHDPATKRALFHACATSVDEAAQVERSQLDRRGEFDEPLYITLGWTATNLRPRV